MKRFFPLLLATIGLSSCLLDTTSDYSPSIQLSYAVSSCGDTLGYNLNTTTGIYSMDTVHMGDTVLFAVAFSTYTKNLISTHINWDTTHLQVWSHFDNDYLSAILAESDTTTLDLYYPTNYNYAGVPVYFTPKKAGSSVMKFQVVSDSKYSPAEQTIKIDVAD